jgi:hypothetical protein
MFNWVDNYVKFISLIIKISLQHDIIPWSIKVIKTVIISKVSKVSVMFKLTSVLQIVRLNQWFFFHKLEALKLVWW